MMNNLEKEIKRLASVYKILDTMEKEYQQMVDDLCTEYGSEVVAVAMVKAGLN